MHRSARLILVIMVRRYCKVNFWKAQVLDVLFILHHYLDDKIENLIWIAIATLIFKYEP